MKTSNETRVVVQGPFVLVLPSIVANIAPEFTVDLPQKHTATIYKTTTQRRTASGDGYESVPAYRLIVINSKGRKSGKVRSFGSRNYGDGIFIDDADGLLDLKFAIEGAANELTPKTTRSTSHYEIDEDD